MSTTPSVIALKTLTGAVDGAVKAAMTRHKVTATNGFIINPGTLAGPLLDAATDVKVAQQVADDITKQIQAGQSGIAAAHTATPLQSGVLVTNKWILCGFFPYPAPQIEVER